MDIQKRRIAELRPAEYNPRKALQPGDPEFEKIARSIEEFGYVDPIIINKDGTIIGGHQRSTVLAYMGIDEVDCVVVDMDKDHEKALNIALNKITGEWDEEKLKDLLIDLDQSSFDIGLTGYEQDDLAELIEKFDIPANVSDDGFDADAAAQEIVEPTTRRGDIYQMGHHRLMCGDSTSAHDVALLMGNEEADLVVTDPPYNVALGMDDTPTIAERRHRRTDGLVVQNDKMDDRSFYNFLLAVFGEVIEHTRKGGAIYIFHSSSEAINFTHAMIDAGWDYKQTLIWEKNSFVLGRQDYQWRHEPILYGWKPGAGHYFIKDRSIDTIFMEDEPDFESMKKDELLAWIKALQRESENTTSVIYNKRPTRSKEHPTMKPPELIGKLIQNSSKPGWIVYDPFGGSGSTLIAAEQLGRTCYTSELDPKYCDVIVRRWEEYTGKKAVKING